MSHLAVRPDPHAKKRIRLDVGVEPLPPSVAPAAPISFMPSPQSMASSPESNETSDSAYTPLAVSSQQEAPSFQPHLSSFSGIFDFQICGKPPFENVSAPDGFSCGFCTDSSSCVCREIALRQAPARLDMSAEAPFKVEAAEDKINEPVSEQETTLRSPGIASRMSILDNLPGYQPPIPLRRRTGNSATTKSIFPVHPPSARAASFCPVGPTTCSGDPSNCLACADDDFGKAFCTAVGESVAAAPSCADCPGRAQRGGSDPLRGKTPFKGCCGGSGQCACDSQCDSTTPRASSETAHHALESPPETMPTNDAWRQLKSHPNVSFADLSLLAEVVSRRSKCTGPHVVISPAPGSITPERSLSPKAPVTIRSEESTNGDNNAILLTDPHAHYRAKQQERSSLPSPRLVSEEELLKCGRQRFVREVHTDAVREALRLLDARFDQA